MKDKIKGALACLEGWSSDLNKAANALTIVVTAGKALMDLLK